MNYQETVEMLEHLHSLFAEGGDDSVFSPTQKRWVSSLYKKETGEAIAECGCKNKYTDAVTLLLLRLRKKGMMAEDTTYCLRAGVIIWLNNDCYSRHNLTDEVAKQWLELHPDGIHMFEKTPTE